MLQRRVVVAAVLVQVAQQQPDAAVRDGGAPDELTRAHRFGEIRARHPRCRGVRVDGGQGLHRH